MTKGAVRRCHAPKLLARAVSVAALIVIPRATPMAQASREFPEGAAALTTWFTHVQRDELDSLPALLAPDFVFVTDGARFDRTAFVAMIKRLGISHPRVQLSNIVAHHAGDVGYLVYDRVESFESAGHHEGRTGNRHDGANAKGRPLAHSALDHDVAGLLKADERQG